MKSLFALLLLTGLTLQLSAQSIASRLGYEEDAKLLILHADDLGVAHSVNTASAEAFASGAINSASIMVPCPWLLEIAAIAEEHPEYDLGLHLTLTAEWENYKWGGVTTSPGSTLLNEHGYMYDNTADVNTHGTAEEVRIELQGQVDMARSVGIEPTHLDSHMGALFTPKFFPVYVETGIKNKIPVFVPSAAAALFSDAFPKPDEVIYVNMLGMMSPGMSEDEWISYYTGLLPNAQPGINEIIVHLGHDDKELQAVMVNHPEYGSKWRSLDWQALESKEFRDMIKKLDIKMVTYRQIQEVLYGE